MTKHDIIYKRSVTVWHSHSYESEAIPDHFAEYCLLNKICSEPKGRNK